MDMTDDTALSYDSIQSYVWGVRAWHKMQYYADPVRGVLGWDDFMDSVKVLTWMPHEPRKAADIQVIERIIDDFLALPLPKPHAIQ